MLKVLNQDKIRELYTACALVMGLMEYLVFLLTNNNHCILPGIYRLVLECAWGGGRSVKGGKLLGTKSLKTEGIEAKT